MKVPSRVLRYFLLALGAAAGLSMSACAHKDLTAPCTAGSSWGSAFAADEAGCGLMRPVN
jgi:hypothetical protein